MIKKDTINIDRIFRFIYKTVLNRGQWRSESYLDSALLSPVFIYAEEKCEALGKLHFHQYIKARSMKEESYEYIYYF